LTVGLTLVLAAQLAQPSPGAASPGDYVRYESFDVRMRIEKDGFEEREIRAVQLLRTVEAVRELGQLQFPYFDGQDEVVVDEVSIQKPDGRSVAPKDLVPEVVNPFGVNSRSLSPDFRVHTVTVPGVEPGDRLSYRVVWRRRPLTPGTAFAQLSLLPLPGDPEQRLELDLPRDSPVRARLRDGLGAAWEEVPAAPDRLVRRLRLRVPRPDYGPKGPTPAQRAARLVSDLVITSFGSLDEVARWWWALSKDRMTPDATVKAAAAGGSGGEREMLTRFHALVADRVRYLNVGFGIGRMQPRAAADVLESRYGDCKDKHALLAALARTAGIDVRPVLIHSERRDAIDDAPSPQQFDHVVSVARLTPDPSGWLWMDTTNNFAAPGYLAPQLRNKRALLVEPDGRGVVVTTPERPPFEPRIDVETEGALDASGKLKGHVRWTFRSDLEVPLRAAFTLAPRERHAEMVQRGLARSWKDAVVTSVTFSDPADVATPLRVEFDVERTVSGRRTDREWALSVPMPEFTLPAADALGDDESGPSVEAGLLQARAVIRLPDGARARAPLDVSLERPFGALKSTYSVEGGALRVTRSVRFDRGAAAAAPAAYASFRKAVDTDRDQDFLVAAVDAATATAESLHEEGKAAFDQKDYPRAIELLMRTIDHDPQRADVWNDLGRALRYAGDREAAVEAFALQIETDPFHESAYAERAYTLLDRIERGAAGIPLERLAADYEQAEQDLLKQVEVAPLKPWSYGKLGDIRGARRRHDEAAGYYERAATLEPRNKDHWIRLALQRTLAGRAEEARTALAQASTLELEGWRRLNVARGHWLIGDDVKAGEIASSVQAETVEALVGLSAEKVDTGSVYWTRRMGEVWTLLGSAALAQGDLARAETYLRAGWRAGLQPSGAWGMGRLRARQGRSAEAAQWFANAASMRDAWFTLPHDHEKRADGAARKPAGEAPGANLMDERIVTLSSAPSEDFTEEALLLVRPDGSVAAFKNLSKKTPAAFGRLVKKLGTVKIDLPRPAGAPPVPLVVTGVLSCFHLTTCSLVRDLAETTPDMH
jgi:transglutaminase-like putative cysteine protease/Flp pilus assembly protein TadD